ncbi:MAG: InlB B-repeat-containing protein [Clostridia bacterium]|nr:InlB B-repeat-containing protein [Clostridia bacterium]
MTSTKRFIRLMAALLALIFVVNTAPLAALAESMNEPEAAAEQPAEHEHDHDHDHDHDHEKDAEETGEGIISQLADGEGNTLYREVKFALPDGLTDEEAEEITLPETKMVENGSLVFAVPQPEQEHYTFGGWYYDPALTEPADGWDVIDRNMTLYPAFVAIQSQSEDDNKLNFISDLDVEPDFQVQIVAYNLTEDEIRERIKVTNMNKADDNEEFTLERLEPDLYTLIPDEELRARALETVQAYLDEDLDTTLTEGLKQISVEEPEVELTPEEQMEALHASAERTADEEARARAPQKYTGEPALDETVINELVFYYAPYEMIDTEAMQMADMVRRARNAGFDPKAITATQLVSIMTEDELEAAGITDPSAVSDGGGTMNLEEYLRPYLKFLPVMHYVVQPKGGAWGRGFMHQIEILDTEYLRFSRYGEETGKYVIYHNITVHQDNFNNIRFNSDMIYLPASEVEGVVLDCGLVRAEGNTAEGLNMVENDDQGVLTYSGGQTIPVGTTVVVYDGTIGENGNVEGSVGYFNITADMGNGQYAYEGPEFTDVVFIPNVIPVKDNGRFSEGQMLIPSDQLRFTGEIYQTLKLDENTVVEPGDYVAAYTGDLNNPDSLALTGYGLIRTVAEDQDGLFVSYDIVGANDIENAISMFNRQDNLDIPMTDEDLEKACRLLEEDVLKSGFVEKSAEHIKKLITADEEDILPDSEYANALTELKFQREDGSEISLDEVRGLAGGSRVSFGPPTIKFNPSLALQHFDGSGVRFEAAIVFQLDIEMNDSSQLELKVVALLELEIHLSYSAGVTADIDYALGIFPYPEEIYGKAGVEAGVYVGVGVTVTLQTVEKEGPDAKEVLEGLGTGDLLDTKGYVIDGAEKKDIVQDIGKIGLMSQQLGPIADMARIGGAGGDGLGISKIPGQKPDYWGVTDTEDGTQVDGWQEMENSVGGTFEEKYSNFLQDSGAEYVPLFEREIFTFEIHDPSGIMAASLGLSIFVDFQLNVMLGASATYENCKEASVSFSVFHPTSKSHVGDTKPPCAQIDFYIFGMVGIKAGVALDFRIGIISTRIASIGIVVKVGLYIEFYGFFYIAYKCKWYTVPDGKDKDGNDKTKTKKEESTEMFGAMRLEVGIFLDILFRAQLGGGALQKDAEIYSAKWPLLALGPDYIPIDFLIEEVDDSLNLNIEPRQGDNDKRESTATNVIGGASIQVPDDLFQIKQLQISTGELSIENKDKTKAYNHRSGSFVAGDVRYYQMDEECFHVTFTPKGANFGEPTDEDLAKGGFLYEPYNNTIYAKPSNKEANELWGEFEFKYYQTNDPTKEDAELSYGAGFSLNTREISRTVRVHWKGELVNGSADIYISKSALEERLEKDVPAFKKSFEGLEGAEIVTTTYARSMKALDYLTFSNDPGIRDKYFTKEEYSIPFDGFDGVTYYLNARKLAQDYPSYRLAFSKEKYNYASLAEYKNRYNNGYSDKWTEIGRFIYYESTQGQAENEEDSKGWMLVMPNDPYLYYTMCENGTKVELYFIKGYTETDWYILDENYDFEEPEAFAYQVEILSSQNAMDNMPASVRKVYETDQEGYEYVWYSYSDTQNLYQNTRAHYYNGKTYAGRVLNFKENESKSVGATTWSIGKNYIYTDNTLTCMPRPEDFIYNPSLWEKVTDETLIPLASTVYFAIRVPKTFTVTYLFEDGGKYTEKFRFGDDLQIGFWPTKDHYTFLGWFGFEDGVQYTDAVNKGIEAITTMPARDLTLYPLYLGDPVTINWSFRGKTYSSQVRVGDRMLSGAPDLSKEIPEGKEVIWFGGYNYRYRVANDEIVEYYLDGWTYKGRVYGYKVSIIDERKYINSYKYNQLLSEYQNAKKMLKFFRKADLINYIMQKGLVGSKLYFASEEDAPVYILPIDTSQVEPNPGYDMYLATEDGTEITNSTRMPAEDLRLYVKWRPKEYTYAWVVRETHYDEEQEKEVATYQKLDVVKSQAVVKTIGDIRPEGATIKDKDTRYVWKVFRYDYSELTTPYYRIYPEIYLENRYLDWNKKTYKNSDKLPENDAIFIVNRVKRTVKVTWKYKDGDETKDWWIARKLEAPRNQTWYDEMYNIVGWADEDGNTYEYPPLELERLVLYPILEEHEHAWQLIRRLPASCDQVGIDEYECQLCHKTRQEELPMIDHYVLYWNDHEPTCTERGYKVGYCSSCEQWVYEYYGEPLGHDFDTGVIGDVVEATCTTDGSYKVFDQCKRCYERRNEQTFVTPALGHSEEEIHENEVASTCTEEGSYVKIIRCKRCGEELSRETVAIPAHGHSFYEPVTEPTCTEKGYTTHTCVYEGCGYSYTDTETDPLGHDYQKGETVAPTCKDDGYTIYTCSRCQDSYKGDIVPAANTEHVAGDPVRTEPYPIMKQDEYGNRWCEGWVAGDITTKCTICGAVIKTEVIKVVPKVESWQDGKTLPMEMLQDWKNGGATTLGDVGYINGMYIVFASSGNVRSEDRYNIDADVYFTDSSKAIADIQSGDQVKVHIKPRGDYAKTYAETDVTFTVTGDGHVHNLVQVEAKAATCTEDGWEAYEYCTDCDYTTKVVIPSRGGHNMVQVEGKAATCVADGWDAYEQCTNCEYNTKQVIPATGQHSLVDVEAQPAVEGQDGWEAYKKCENCDYTTTITVVHFRGDIIGEPQAATCTSPGYETCICKNCGVTFDYITDPINPNAHNIDNGVCQNCGKPESEIAPPAGN